LELFSLEKEKAAQLPGGLFVFLINVSEEHAARVSAIRRVELFMLNLRSIS
jgi:hypothetical protein